MKIFILFFATLFFSFLAVPLFIKISKKLDILDRPDSNHKSHQTPIPYLGGMAILSSFIASTIFIKFILDLQWTNSSVFALTSALALIAFLGLSDDIKPRGAAFRLVIQNLIAASAVVVLFFEDLISINVFESRLLNLGICLLWVVAICNFVNMFDNHDGSAAGVCFIILVAISVISSSQNQLILFPTTIALAASTLGFLIWNFPPAKVYLGDSGAMLLGLGIGLFTIQLDVAVESPLLSWTIPLLLVGTLATDFTIAVVSRIRRGISPMIGDKAHIAHRLLRLKRSKIEVTLIIWTLTLIFVSIAILVTQTSNTTAWALVLFAACLYLFLVRFFLKLKDE